MNALVPIGLTPNDPMSRLGDVSSRGREADLPSTRRDGGCAPSENVLGYGNVMGAHSPSPIRLIDGW